MHHRKTREQSEFKRHCTAKAGLKRNQKKHLVAVLPNGIEVFFLKLGKEARAFYACISEQKLFQLNT